MKLLLPLKYYDEAGRVKPPISLYWVILFLCRSLVILAGSLSSQQYSKELLAMFYADSRFLYINIFIALPTFVALLIMGFREKLWQKNRVWLFTLIIPLMIFSCIVDVAYHLFVANLQHWQFSWVIAITLIADVFCLYFLSKDKHASFMVFDWRTKVAVTPDN
ncbi:DUF2919 family protein [Paraglaciecola sp. L3A3]|uniref:DUF2919 family protein n=1 Tax=Paraglaciecola sp. L3A3 TaxID=2686358 RepID=UPI00131CCEDB|nr:DUF2919 family protein [Paraglaciecola sp. L3A3]